MSELDAWLPAIAAGDPHAFGQWVAGVEARLRASLRPLAASVDVEAVMQEALLRVWQVAPRFVPDGRPDGLLRLAVRIARNVAVSELRRLRPDAVDAAALERALAGAEPPRDLATPDPHLRALIGACREELPEQPRRALAARLEDGGLRADEALADALAMRLNTFLQNITRARKLLAACLEKHGVDLGRELA